MYLIISDFHQALRAFSDGLLLLGNSCARALQRASAYAGSSPDRGLIYKYAGSDHSNHHIHAQLTRRWQPLITSIKVIYQSVFNGLIAMVGME
nr:hypothetical protein [Comamonas koreensis]